MAKIEKEILRQSTTKPIFWKRFIDDVISMWNTSRDKIEDFLVKANSFHPTIKFTAEISETETTFLDTKVTKVTDSMRNLFLTCERISKLQKPFNTRISIRVTRQASVDIIKGEELRLLRTNSSQFTFEENIRNFKTHLQNRDYPARIVEKHLSEIKFSDREKSLAQKNKTARKKILPFVTQYHPALPNLKDTPMGRWHHIENQPQLREIFKEPPTISYRKEKSLKDILVKAKL